MACSNDSPNPIMQTDALKPFYTDIGNYGLEYAYKKYGKVDPTLGAFRISDLSPNELKPYEYNQTEHSKTVVIVGAGVSGLVAAYELTRAGHQVKIIERQHRVGGRCRTFSKEFFTENLWSDAGAMRLPSEAGASNPKHFLTDFYGIEKFDLHTQNFQNQTENGFYYLYGQKFSTKDMSAAKCDEFWKNWDSQLTPEIKSQYKITDIASYYGATIAPILDDIRTANDGNPQKADWNLWLARWSMFSVNDFLRSSYDGIKTALTNRQKTSVFQNLWDQRIEDMLCPLKDLLTWPEVAISGFCAYNYNPGLDISLAELLRDELGLWWKDPMHTFENGMHSLPQAFMGPHPSDHTLAPVNLSENITYGAQAWKICYGDKADEKGKVNVVALNATNQQMLKNDFSGHALIMTLPLNIIRQITFSPPLSSGLADSLADIFYSPSTKIMLQCKTRFWEHPTNEDEKPIYGGFSFTNLPIGQIHYPTKIDGNTNERGVLMCYTWKQDALLFGSQSQNAITEAVEEVAEIHPEIVENFEVGAVQAWYSDINSQGAFALLKPFQVQNIVFKLMQPYPSNKPQIYFAGEAVSFTNGWIQGALEAGLNAAYQFYYNNEEQYKPRI